MIATLITRRVSEGKHLHRIDSRKASVRTVGFEPTLSSARGSRISRLSYVLWKTNVAARRGARITVSAEASAAWAVPGGERELARRGAWKEGVGSGVWLSPL